VDLQRTLEDAVQKGPVLVFLYVFVFTKDKHRERERERDRERQREHIQCVRTRKVRKNRMW